MTKGIHTEDGKKYWEPYRSGKRVLIHKKDEIDEELVAEGAFLPAQAKRPGRHDDAVAVFSVEGEAVPVSFVEKRRLRRIVGYVEGRGGGDGDARFYALCRPRWALLLLLLPIAVLLVLCLQLAACPASSPLITGGVVPSVEVAQPAEVGSIEIPGYSDLEVKGDTRLLLSNPESNADYLLKYTCTVGGEVVHESPYWVEPGRCDAWQPAADLAAYKGETIEMKISISTCKASTQEGCNGVEQTVKVTVAG